MTKSGFSRTPPPSLPHVRPIRPSTRGEVLYGDTYQPVGNCVVEVCEDRDKKWSAWVFWIEEGKPDEHCAHVRRFSKETAMFAGKSEARTEHHLRGMTLPLAFTLDDDKR